MARPLADDGSRWLARFTTVFERELRTVARSRTLIALAAGFALLVVGLAAVAGIGGYVPLALTLVTPLELLVPTLAAAFGYHAVLGDREREELVVLRTFPVGRGAYLAGVYAGRLVGLLVAVGGPLLALWATVPFVRRADTFLFQTGGLDSPVLFLRFVVLTLAFAAVLCSVVVSLSAAVGGRRRTLVAVVGLCLASAVGVDLLVIAAAGGGTAGVPTLAVLGPNGAYRGLVLALVLDPVVATRTATAPVLACLGSLLVWFAVPLVASSALVWQEPD